MHFGAGGGIQRKTQAAAIAGQRLPHGGIGFVSGIHGHAIGGQCRDHAAVLVRHGLDRAHELLVLTLGVVDQCDRGRSHLRQSGNLAGVVHAQFDHGHTVRIAQAQQRQRHANVVIQIALRGEGGIACCGTQDGRNHLRHGRLAVAAGHGNQRQRELRAPADGELAQRLLAVGHFQTAPTHGRQLAGLAHGRHGAGFTRLREEAVGIETLALEGNEQVTGLQRARIGMHALHGGGAIAHQNGLRQPPGCLIQRHHRGAHAVAPSRACCTRLSSAICTCS